ncbi:MAG: serine hydrolase domain-containing protein [Vicinamibacterales bacterium]
MRIIAVTLLALLLWMTTVVAGALFGWWRGPVAPAGDPQAFMRAAVALIDASNKGNTAFLLIEDGQVAAEYYSATADRIERDTVFATASMSKWITAHAVMALVEQGRLDLDRPVEDYLTRWRLPASGFDHRGVTTRRLLSHTAGLTDGLGFGDYGLDETVPALEQSLAAPRSSSGLPVAIAVGREPGTEWQYSGGGYLVLELLVEEVSGERFETFVTRAILQPLGMTRSGYSDLGSVEPSAKSYDRSGRPATIYRYASKAATGFTTSPGDMATFVLAQLAGDSVPWLTSETRRAMRQPEARIQGFAIWGLGTMLYAPASNGEVVFGHDGANEPAVNATVRINPETKDGIVVLVTGSPALATTIGSQWVFWQTGAPDFLSVPEEVRRVVPALFGGTVVILLLAIVWHRRARRRSAHAVA